MNMKAIEIAALGGVGLVVAVALVFGGGTPNNPSTPTPAATSSPGKGKVSKSAPANAAAASATKPKVNASLIVGGLIPSQKPAKPLKSGWVLRRISIAETPAESGQSPNWVPIASLWTRSPTTAWSTLIPKKIRPLAPARGLLKTEFVTWIRVAHSASESIVLSLGGGGGQVSLSIDGHPGPLIRLVRTCNPFSGCGPAPTVGAAIVGLAAGWHLMHLTVVSELNRPPLTSTVYGRGVGSGSPTEFVSYQTGKNVEKTQAKAPVQNQ